MTLTYLLGNYEWTVILIEVGVALLKTTSVLFTDSASRRRHACSPHVSICRASLARRANGRR